MENRRKKNTGEAGDQRDRAKTGRPRHTHAQSAAQNLPASSQATRHAQHAGPRPTKSPTGMSRLTHTRPVLSTTTRRRMSGAPVSSPQRGGFQSAQTSRPQSGSSPPVGSPYYGDFGSAQTPRLQSSGGPPVGSPQRGGFRSAQTSRPQSGGGPPVGLPYRGDFRSANTQPTKTQRTQSGSIAQTQPVDSTQAEATTVTPKSANSKSSRDPRTNEQLDFAKAYAKEHIEYASPAWKETRELHDQVFVYLLKCRSEVNASCKCFRAVKLSIQPPYDSVKKKLNRHGSMVSRAMLEAVRLMSPDRVFTKVFMRSLTDAHIDISKIAEPGPDLLVDLQNTNPGPQNVNPEHSTESDAYPTPRPKVETFIKVESDLDTCDDPAPNPEFDPNDHYNYEQANVTNAGNERDFENDYDAGTRSANVYGLDTEGTMDRTDAYGEEYAEGDADLGDEQNTTYYRPSKRVTDDLEEDDVDMVATDHGHSHKRPRTMSWKEPNADRELIDQLQKRVEELEDEARMLEEVKHIQKSNDQLQKRVEELEDEVRVLKDDKHTQRMFISLLQARDNPS